MRPRSEKDGNSATGERETRGLESSSDTEDKMSLLSLVVFP